MSGDDPDWGTIQQACKVVAGDAKPISLATYYRGAKKGLYTPPEKVSPNVSRVDLNKLRALVRARRSGSAKDRGG